MKEKNNSIMILKKEDIVQKITKIFWIFLTGSILGYIIEMIVGLVTYYLVTSYIKKKSYLKIFFISMILGGIVEYLFSYFQEKFFGTISWDYSNLLFNINGRTSLLHCLYWGTGGVLFVKFILPLINKLNTWCKKTHFRCVTALLGVFIIFDIIISGMAGARQLERKNNIEPEGYIDTFFDKHYPDAKLEKIYSNAKMV